MIYFLCGKRGVEWVLAFTNGVSRDAMGYMDGLAEGSWMVRISNILFLLKL